MALMMEDQMKQKKNSIEVEETSQMPISSLTDSNKLITGHHNTESRKKKLVSMRPLTRPNITQKNVGLRIDILEECLHRNSSFLIKCPISREGPF